MKNMKEKVYVTLVASDFYHGVDIYYPGQKLTLIKERTNTYDAEAIAVYYHPGVMSGYVANSINTVARGTHSAGYIHHMFDEEIKCIVRFVVRKSVIAEVLFEDEDNVEVV